MGARYRACDCRGIEWILYDRTPADGPRRTMCLGRVRTTTCYRFMGGPQIECPRYGEVLDYYKHSMEVKVLEVLNSPALSKP